MDERGERLRMSPPDRDEQTLQDRAGRFSPDLGDQSLRGEHVTCRGAASACSQPRRLSTCPTGYRPSCWKTPAAKSASALIRPTMAHLPRAVSTSPRMHGPGAPFAGSPPTARCRAAARSGMHKTQAHHVHEKHVFYVTCSIAAAAFAGYRWDISSHFGTRRKVPGKAASQELGTPPVGLRPGPLTAALFLGRSSPQGPAACDRLEKPWT